MNQRMSVSDDEVTRMMMRFGGVFIPELAEIYRLSDPATRLQLRLAFHEEWEIYTEFAVLWKTAGNKVPRAPDRFPPELIDPDPTCVVPGVPVVTEGLSS
jgi:hypothetical protein